jgi:multidrug efflux pump subunit AcrA (membrane-fusion protein)
VTSALDARPKLKEDVKIVRREIHGKVHYVVKEPKEQKYYQFGETEVGLMRLMDGHRTPADISDAADKSLGVRPPAGQVADFAHKLKRLGLVERTPVEQHLMLMEHLRSQRKVRTRQRTKGSILRLRFSIGDPHHLFARTVRRIPWMWSPAFVWACIALFAVYLAIVVSGWDEFWAGTVGLVTLSGFSIWDWVLVYTLLVVIIGIHELGHGLTTTFFGGEVHEIGAMIMYFSPALYCNTNDAWTFDRRSRRLWVTFAGPWIQLVIAALAAIVWVLTEPGTFINWVAFLAVLVGGISSVLANLNPLIPLDGYYALSDWLEIPNLRRRAFDYMSWIGKRFVLGVDAAEPGVTPRERRIFLIYGSLAFAYSAFIIVASLFWLVLVIGRFIGPFVWLIVLFSVAGTLHGLLGRSRALVTAAATSRRAGFLGGRRAAVLLAAVALLIVLPFILPWTTRAKGDFRIEALPRALVRAQVDGILDSWHVREGDAVRAGDPIATLWSPELESAFLEQRARVERLALSRAQAEADGDLATAASTSSVLKEAQQELGVLQARRERLVVRAPIDGVVLGHRLEERLGTALGDGALLVEIASPDRRYARVRLPPKKAGDIEPGQAATLKLFAQPRFKFVATVSAVAPAARDGWLEAGVVLPANGWLPDPGMTGIAKIQTRRGTIASAIARAVRQTIRIDLWL